MRKPTMSDVAREAGVDVSTVSRALNPATSHLLRPKTVERILTASRDLGYRPNAIARGLRTQKTHTIGMVIPDLTNPFFPPVARGVEDELTRDGYTLIITNTDNDERRERRAISSLVERQVDGLLLMMSHIESQPNESNGLSGIPIVLLNRCGPDTAVPRVVPDDVAGVRQVVEHLVALGHRKVGHVAGPQDTSTGRTRLAVFESAPGREMFDAGAIEVAAVFDIQAGRSACSRLLDAHPDLTAIFAANDLLAIGCLLELRSRGRRVPDDVSVVGYNDMPLVDLVEPPLTTVRVPQYEMGQKAARIMLDLLAGREPAEVQTLMVPRFVERGSTAPPPASASEAGGRIGD